MSGWRAAAALLIFLAAAYLRFVRADPKPAWTNTVRQIVETDGAELPWRQEP